MQRPDVGVVSSVIDSTIENVAERDLSKDLGREREDTAVSFGKRWLFCSISYSLNHPTQHAPSIIYDKQNTRMSRLKMLSVLMGRTTMLMVVVADRELAADQAPRLLTVVSRATYRYTNRHLIQS